MDGVCVRLALKMTYNGSLCNAMWFLCSFGCNVVSISVKANSTENRIQSYIYTVYIMCA